MILAGVPLDAAAAALAGLIAGALMETPLYLQRALRAPVHQDVFTEGGLLLGMRGPLQRPVGYLGHAALSVVIALVYAGFFQVVGARNHLLAWGALGGLLHFVVGGSSSARSFPSSTGCPGSSRRRQGSPTSATGDATSSPSSLGTCPSACWSDSSTPLHPAVGALAAV